MAKIKKTKGSSNTSKKLISIRVLDPNMHLALKNEAKEQSKRGSTVSVSDLIRQAIFNFLAK